MHLEPQTDMYLRVADVAELLSVNRRTVWRWVDEGRLPSPIRLTARTVRWPASELQSYLDGARSETPRRARRL